MNSEVSGYQTTVTETRIKLLPSADGIRFDVINSGDITSQTTGINRQALVESSGSQHFEATKPFWFDGTRFLTKPAYGTVQASQSPQRVISAVGARLPVLSGVGDRIAWNEVIRRGPQINQAVAEDVSRDVFPRVDRIVDNDFAALGLQWAKLQQSAENVLPSSAFKWVARSTESLSSIWVEEDESSRRQPPIPHPLRTLESSEDLAFFVSEDTVERALSQYVRGGVTLTDNQLQQLQAALKPRSGDTMNVTLARLQSTLKSLQSDRTEATLFSIELPTQKPLQVKFEAGDIRVMTTFQVHPKLGASSGWMTTSFNFRGKRLSTQEWTMALRSVDVNALNGAEETDAIARQTETGLQIPGSDEKSSDEVTTVQVGTAWNSIIEAAAQGIGKKIPETPLPLEFSTGKALPGARQLRIVQVDSNNGVLRCSFRFR